MAMTMAEKLCKEFVDAGIMLEKKKETVVSKIKSAIDELEAQRGACVGMIKENPKESGAQKEKIAHLATRIDDLMTKLEKIEKSKKEIENKEDKKQDKKKK
jgi:chromosome segregation ATPase